ncbi:hemin transporter [Kitasatospora sp. MMS16-BH015]|uniref:globin domain-containing protein n=1 Tax=Kitasatospora sp. MMS16-BH015 TaxID=2018025 RepID=UPI000CA11D29|nr:globin domain-containing protein [Kitasatospora sp. MMS16-BH015]AUG81276.1 hemin transporter [Kitasatospora sp. MMS16-BH015]
MLSPQSTEVVRATLPAVGGALGEITARFYAGMFAAHPELERDLFNRGNQAAGAQRRALAGAIAAYATMLVEHPEVRPGAMLARIAHKHVSLGVTEDQYKIVHQYLFAAIVDVLGEAVTPEVAAAWDEVYWLMAGELIALETRLYDASGALPGAIWTDYVVTSRTPQGSSALALTLRPADGSPAPAFAPGQYVSVAVHLPDGARQIRQYSLSAAPGAEGYRITVKRDGEVSQWLHSDARVGTVLALSRPCGDLTLAEGEEPLLLASAGIGVTPMVGMLDHLVRTGATRPTTVVHGDRSPADHAHAADLTTLVARLPAAELHRWYETDAPTTDRTGYVDLTDLPLPEGLRAYLCGPLPFMRAARATLLARGIPSGRIHYEVFGPDLWIAG